MFADHHSFYGCIFLNCPKEINKEAKFMAKCWDYDHVCHFAFQLCDMFQNGKPLTL